jgi:hypothetical protein
MWSSYNEPPNGRLRRCAGCRALPGPEFWLTVNRKLSPSCLNTLQELNTTQKTPFNWIAVSRSHRIRTSFVDCCSQRGVAADKQESCISCLTRSLSNKVCCQTLIRCNAACSHNLSSCDEPVSDQLNASSWPWTRFTVSMSFKYQSRYRSSS